MACGLAEVMQYSLHPSRDTYYQMLHDQFFPTVIYAAGMAMDILGGRLVCRSIMMELHSMMTPFRKLHSREYLPHVPPTREAFDPSSIMSSRHYGE